MPLVSFVVPCYNDGHFLAECIGSILAQTFADFEVLVMDDCSPDDTPAIARSIADPRVVHVRNERNLGHLANYNKGIGLARGRYIWLINVDDYLRRSYVLERFVAVMERTPSAAYVFCRAMSVRGSTEREPHALHGTSDTVFGGHAFVSRLVDRNTIATPAVMVRKGSYDRVGLFPLDLPHAGDWFQWCRHAMHGDVAYLAEPMVCYRVHAANMSKQFLEERPRELIRDEVEVRWRVRAMADGLGLRPLVDAATAAIARDYGHRVGLRLTEQWPLGLTFDEFEASLAAHTGDPRLIARITATVLRCVGDEYYGHGQPGQARQYYRQALARNPHDVATWVKRGLLATRGLGRGVRTASRYF